jgi:hypothetical protein
VAGEPTVIDSSTPFPPQELALPPTNRFNIGVNFDTAASSAARR